MIQGVNVAAVTPRRVNADGVDLGATLELIDFLCDKGAGGIALLGSTGEFSHFDLEQRLHLIQFGVKRSRAPVLVNVSHSYLDGTLALARGAASYGAAALLLMPPIFFRYPQEDIWTFYQEFARDLGVSVPVFLYNVPFFTSEIACETAEGLLAEGHFAGIKDSSGEIEYVQRMISLKQQRPLTVLVGNDKIFTAARSAGADGVVSGVGCALPELMVGLDRAILSGDTTQRDRLELRLQEFIDWIDSFPVPIGVREAVALRGLKTGPHATPLGEGTQRRLGEFREWFQGWLPGMLKEASRA